MKITRKSLEEAFKDENLNLNVTARMILTAYASHMSYRDEAQEAWPAFKKVALFAGVSEDTVTQYVHALVRDGWLIPSGNTHRYGDRHYTHGYYLGHGEVTERVLQRRKAVNPQNLITAPTESDSSKGSTNVRPLRQSRLTTPTEPVDGSDSVGKKNHMNNKEKNHLGTPAGAGVQEVPSLGETASPNKEHSLTPEPPVNTPAPTGSHDSDRPGVVDYKELLREERGERAAAKYTTLRRQAFPPKAAYDIACGEFPKVRTKIAL